MALRFGSKIDHWYPVKIDTGYISVSNTDHTYLQ